jgi:LmbE family N-acetylglucosaminyl deacetylase
MAAPSQRRVVLSLMAHPDDAEILCAGTLIRLADAGWEVHIATVANGDCGSMTLPRERISAIRRREAIAAAAKIDATYHCLEDSDVEVMFDKATNRKVIDLMRRVAPTMLITHPRHDYMLDHEQVHLLARSTAFSYPIPNASDLPLIPGSAIPWLYYSDPVLSRDPYTNEFAPATTFVDISKQIDRKIEMLACHASQRDWLNAHHGMDEYINAMKRQSGERGKQLGVAYAEAFVLHRGHPFPTTDPLAEL